MTAGKLAVYVILVCLLCHPVLAQERFNADNVERGAAGSSATAGLLILGPDPRPCDAGLEGHIRYSSAKKQVQFCDGSAWRNWSASK